MITKSATLFVDILGKDSNNGIPHVINWERMKPIRSYASANRAWVQTLATTGRDERKYDKEKFGFDFFGPSSLNNE